MSAPKIKNQKHNKKSKKNISQKENKIIDSILLNEYYIIY